MEGVTQIKFYPDSVSIWNNGGLTRKLTIEKLKKKHPSFPRNDLIAETFYKAGLIEKWGYGTVKIVDECSNSGLPDPIFEEEAGGLQITFLKNLLSEDFLRKLQLNDRQIKAVLYVKDYGKISNTEYQKLNITSKRTATEDLKMLSEKGLFRRMGATGRGTGYVLQRGNNGAKRAIEKVSQTGDELDKKIFDLEGELSKVKPNDEVRWHFNREVFYRIYDSWVSELLMNLIPIAQKFNRLFNSPKHFIYVINGIGQIGFIDDKPEIIIKKLRANCEKYSEPIYDATINFYLNYGTFRKGGLKTFGCNYGIEIKFEMIKFIVSVDQFVQDGTIRSKVPKIERLLHQPLTKNESKNIATEFGQTIFAHIEYYTKKVGII